MDEKLGEEEGSLKEKNDAIAECREYIGQMKWLISDAMPAALSCFSVRQLSAT